MIGMSFRTLLRLYAHLIVVCCVSLVKLARMPYSVKILSNEEPTTKPLSTITLHSLLRSTSPLRRYVSLTKQR
jgi:hypothetical protein